MTRDRLGSDHDRLTATKLTTVAHRHARWGALTEDEMTAGAAELRDLAGDRPDLLAELAGLALGTAGEKARSTGRRRRPWPGCAA